MEPNGLASHYYKDYAAQAGAGHPYENPSGFADFAGADDIFAELFRRQAQQSRRRRGADLRYRLAVEFLDAIKGASKRLTLPDGGTLDVTIPPGIQEGQILRLRGKGAPSGGEGEAGDALVEISVMPHRFFTRVGDDIHLELPVTLAEAFLGSHVKVPTPTGPVMLKVPKGSNTGSVLRLKGKGVPRQGGHGDELVKLKVMLPSGPNPELETFLSNWSRRKELRPAKGYAAMIISKLDFLYRAQLDQETLEVWIEEEWLVPSETAGEPAFSEADLARAKLIRDLKHDMGVNDEGVGIILNLLDQMHSLRKAMADMLPSKRGRSDLP